MKTKPAISEYTCEGFEELARRLPFDVDAIDTFNKQIQAAIELLPVGELQTRLAVCRDLTNLKFNASINKV